MDRKIEKKQFLMPTRYWLWAAAGVALASSLTYLAMGSYTTTLSVDRAELSIDTVKSGSFNDYIQLNASAVPIQMVHVSPEEGGIVRELCVEEGAVVRKGDVLVRLANTNLSLQILNAESELAEKQNMLRNTQITMEQDRLNNQYEALQLAQELVAKRRHWERQERLWQERLIPQEDYLKAREDYELVRSKHALVSTRLQKDSLLRHAQMEQMEDNLSAMQQNVELVRQRMDRLEVRAAIDGEVGLLNAELGQSVQVGSTIGMVNDLSSFRLESYIDEHYIERVAPGLTAQFEQGGDTFELRLRKVYPEVRSGRFRVDFLFTGAKPKNLRNGQTFYIELRLGEPRMATIIPRGTFFAATGGQWIFVLSPDGSKARRREIRIGRQNPKCYEVLDGLQPGERVVTRGYEAFKEMQTLEIE